MGQTTILIMILTIVSKIFGFVRESVMAAFIGAGELKSIYTTTLTIPNTIIGIFASGLLSAYIPIYNKAKNEDGENKAKDFTSNLINILMIYGLITFVIVFIFAKPISLIFSPQLRGESLLLAANFTRIIGASIFVFLYSSVMKGFMNIKGNFIEPVLVGFILNILLIFTTILTGELKNPYILIIGTLIAYIIQFIRFPVIGKRLGYNHKKIINFKDKHIKQLLLIMIPITISNAANSLSSLIDNSMASAFFGVASVSKMFYSKTMLNFITGVVTMTVATVSFPEIARLGQAGEIDNMKKSVSSGIIITMILVIPATLGMMSLSNPIIKLAFERNAFTSSDTEIVASLLVAYGPFIIFDSLIKLMANAFYSVGNSKIPLIVILIQQAINIALNFILIDFFGINGLAYATSISLAIGTIILILLFQNKFGKLNNKNSIFSIFKILFAALIMSYLASKVYILASTNFGLIISLILSVSIAGIIYLLLIYISKIDQVNELITSVKNKLKS